MFSWLINTSSSGDLSPILHLTGILTHKQTKQHRLSNSFSCVSVQTIGVLVHCRYNVGDTGSRTGEMQNTKPGGAEMYVIHV